MWFSEKAKTDEHVYRRPLPSGGYVAIATQEVRPLFSAPKLRGHVVVERRSAERRIGHPAPIVAVTEHEDLAAILAALMPIAESDDLLSEPLTRRVTVPITHRRSLPSA